MHACTGILFNHESPLRPERFVTQKIVRAASRIAGAATETLTLGNIDIHRDWGWAPEYVEVMWRCCRWSSPRTWSSPPAGRCRCSTSSNVHSRHFGLDWRKHVSQR